MIAVFMGHQNAREIFRSARNGCQALPDLARAEPRIYQNASFISLDICAIAAGTAAENRKADGHGANDRDGMAERNLNQSSPREFFSRIMVATNVQPH